MRKEIQRCPACGKEELLYAQSNWCDCNGASATAPFRMVPKSVSDATDGIDSMLAKLKEDESALARIRAFKKATKDWK